jgi:hypothetical protein
MGSFPPQSAEQIATELLKESEQGLHLIACKTLQSLWAGYGHICQISAEKNCQPVSLILKHIDPPSTRVNGSKPDEGHIRKILSYQVEQYFYTHLAPQMPNEIAVASCLASASPGLHSNATAMLLSDLRRTHPTSGEKRAELSERQVYAALEWLATFHGFWWNRTKDFEKSKLCLPPLEHFQKHRNTSLEDSTVWLNGGYT